MNSTDINQQNDEVESSIQISDREIAAGSKYNLNTQHNLSTQHLRAVAISAGDYQIAVNREVRRLLAENHGNPLQATKIGLEQLSENKLISLKELKLLSQISDAVFAAQRGKVEPEKAFAKVRAIYDQMLVNNNTSLVALAIASVSASGSVVINDNVDVSEGTIAAAANRNNVDIGLVGGAAVGALIGGWIGGPGGAITGAVIGGIAGGGAAICAD